MRSQPGTPPDVSKRPNDLITETRRYRVITPLFGGGVEPGNADPITVVRATEVRGHLRFWWRATRGGQFNGSLAAMKAVEERIWGSAAAEDRPGPSKISVIVTPENEGHPDRPFEVVANRDNRPTIRPRSASAVHPYAGFPLQPEQGQARIGMETKSVQANVMFALTIVFPAQFQADVTAALWAWETFGGLGARTRRGFGALQCTHRDGVTVELPTSAQAASWISDHLGKYVVTGRWPEHVPHLSTESSYRRVLVRQDNPLRVWRKLIDDLKTFRQARRPGAQGANQRPGRSYWPEAEEIRNLTRQRSPNHQLLGDGVHKFPRAKFGLPIIFHFKDMNRRNPDDPRSDPADTTLQGRGTIDRLASPLILRPLATTNDQAVGLAAVLIGCEEPRGGVILKIGRRNQRVQTDVNEGEAARIRPLNGNTDILQAFLNTL
ncbi:MAG: type III-B CRISPR module RAMP protein Cmr1 [Anaerolineae bacterium]